MAMNDLRDWFSQASSTFVKSCCSDLRHCCEELLSGENNAQHIIFTRPVHKKLALFNLFQLSVDLEREGGNEVLQELHDENASISRQVLHDTIINAAVQYLEQFTMPLLRAWSTDSVFAAITMLWELMFASHTLTPHIRLAALRGLCRAYDVCSERVLIDPAYPVPEDPGYLTATPLMDNNRRQMLWDVLLAPAVPDPEVMTLKQLAGSLLQGCAQEGGERWLASATSGAGLLDLRIVLDTAGASSQHKLLAVNVMYRLAQRARTAYGPGSQHLMHGDEGKRLVPSLERLLLLLGQQQGQQEQGQQQGQQEQEEPGATQAAIRQAARLIGERHSDVSTGATDQQGVWRYTVPDHELSVRPTSLATAAVLVARFKERSAEDGWVRIRGGMVRLFRVCQQAQEELVLLAAAASTQEQAIMVLELLERLVAGADAGGISALGWQHLCSAATLLAQVTGATAAGQVPPQRAAEVQQARALLAVVTPIWQELGPGLGPPGAAQQDTRPLPERALRCADRICAKLQHMAGMATTNHRGGLQQLQVLGLLKAGTGEQLWPLVASSAGMLLAMRQAEQRRRLQRRSQQPLAAVPGAAQEEEGQVHDDELAFAACKALLLATGKVPDDKFIAAPAPAPADDADGAGGGAADDGREAACAALEELLVDLQGSDAQAVLAAVLHQQLIPQLLARLTSGVAGVVPGLGLGARLALGGLCAVRGVAGRLLLQAGVLGRMEPVVQACRAAGQQAEQLQAELLWAAAALHDDQVAAISAAGVSGYGRLVRHVVHEPRLSKASAAAVWSLVQSDPIFRTSPQLPTLLVNHLPAALQALLPLVRHELRSRQGQAALVEAQAAAGGLAHHSPPAAGSCLSGSRHLQATAAALSAVQLVAWAAGGGVPLQGTGAVAQVAASLAEMCDVIALMLFPEAGTGVLLGNAEEQGSAGALAALLGVLLCLRAALLRALPLWQVEEQQEEQAQAVTAGAVSLWRILYTGQAYSQALGCPHLPAAAAEVMGIAQQLPLPATPTTVLHTAPLPAGNTMQAAGQLLDSAQELLQVHAPAVLAAAAVPGEQGHHHSAAAAICHAALCCLAALAAADDPARQGIMQREPVMAAVVALLAGPQQQGQAATLATTALRLLVQLVHGSSAHEQLLLTALPGLLPALAAQLAVPEDASGPAAAEAVRRQRQVLALLQALTAGNAAAAERVAAAAAQQLYLLFLPAQADDELAVLALELLRVMAESSDQTAKLITQAGQAIVVVLQQLG